MKWCDHRMTSGNQWVDCFFNPVSESHKFCPICGTPKPEPKSLAEELYLAWMGDAIPAYEWDDSEMSEERIDWQRVADKAREYILNDIKKKMPEIDDFFDDNSQFGVGS